MTSAAQILANRANARKSTGPRTPEGKAKVARNAVKHGLRGRATVIEGEDPGEFAFCRDQMLAELAPVGTGESQVAERIVVLFWRLRRAERRQNMAFETLYDRCRAREAPARGPGGGMGMAPQTGGTPALGGHPRDRQPGAAVPLGDPIRPVNPDHGQDAHAPDTPIDGATLGRMLLMSFDEQNRQSGSAFGVPRLRGLGPPEGGTPNASPLGHVTELARQNS